MHSGDSFVGSMCKCMECARKRWQRAEKLAMVESVDFFELAREEAQLESELKFAQEKLKVTKKDKADLVNIYYHKLVAEANEKD